MFNNDIVDFAAIKKTLRDGTVVKECLHPVVDTIFHEKKARCVEKINNFQCQL